MNQVISVSERFAVETSSVIRSSLRDALRLRPDSVIVDLSKVGYMDTSGIATLIEAMGIARRQGSRLILRGVQEQPRYFLKVTDLDRIFPIEEELTP